MYAPLYNLEKDWKEISKVIRENSFGILVTTKNGLPLATHIPIELETTDNGTTVLRGHVARANEQWQTFETMEQAMAIFTAPHHYVSSSWYHKMSVPTWNYIAVHMYGKMKFVNDESLKNSLRKLMDTYEVISKNPQQLDALPQDDVDKLMKGVVGFEMSIDKVEARFKLSQNKDDEDYQRVIHELKALDDYHAKWIAEEMERRKV